MRKPPEISLDTDSATIRGYWVGLGGLACGLIGICVSIYPLLSNDPSLFWIAISGWIAVIVVAFSMGIVSFRLIRLLSTMNSAMTELSNRLTATEIENARLIDISAYISSKAIPAARRREAGQNPAQTQSTESQG